MARTLSTPAAPAPVKKITRPYPERFRERMDIHTAGLASLLAHAAAETKDKGFVALHQAADKLLQQWKAPYRSHAGIDTLQSPRRGRGIGPVLDKGAKVFLVGSEYERASILYGAKIAQGQAVVEEVKGGWVRVKLPTGQAAVATSRMLTSDPGKAKQAQGDIEQKLAAAGPV
jgi:hypothetical protein